MLFYKDSKGGTDGQKELHSGMEHQQAKGVEGSLKTKTISQAVAEVSVGR